MTDHKTERPLFILYTAATGHTSAQPGTWGAKFFRDHVDDGQWGPSSGYWMALPFAEGASQNL